MHVWCVFVPVRGGREVGGKDKETEMRDGRIKRVRDERKDDMRCRYNDDDE